MTDAEASARRIRRTFPRDPWLHPEPRDYLPLEDAAAAMRMTPAQVGRLCRAGVLRYRVHEGWAGDGGTMVEVEPMVLGGPGVAVVAGPEAPDGPPGEPALPEAPGSAGEAPAALRAPHGEDGDDRPRRRRRFMEPPR